MFRRERFRYAVKNRDDYILRKAGCNRRVPVSACWRFQTCDPSGTAKETSDYMVVMTFDVTPVNELIDIGIIRIQADSADRSSFWTTIAPASSRGWSTSAWRARA